MKFIFLIQLLGIISYMFKRTLIISDEHGCLDELGSLLDLFDYRRAHGRLIFVGDLINRGSDSMRALKLIAKSKANYVFGNNELLILKFLDTSVIAQSTFIPLKKPWGTVSIFGKPPSFHQE